MSSEKSIKKAKKDKKIGERLKTVRNSLKMGSQSQFSEKLGINQATLSKYENGTTDIPDEIKVKLGEFGINLHWLITGDGSIFRRTETSGNGRLPIFKSSELPNGSFVVPLLDQRLSAGHGTYLPEKDENKALIPVPSYLSQYGRDIAALTVEGDSMMPTLHRGDMVVCDSCGWSGEGVYAIQMGGDGFVKRITKRPGKIVVISDNPKYPPHEEPEESEDLKIIGRVHCAITKVE